jgi:hypothetical protein
MDQRQVAALTNPQLMTEITIKLTALQMSRMIRELEYRLRFYRRASRNHHTVEGRDTEVCIAAVEELLKAIDRRG